MRFTDRAAAALWLLGASTPGAAFVVQQHGAGSQLTVRSRDAHVALESSATSDEFASFAASLEDGDRKSEKASAKKRAPPKKTSVAQKQEQQSWQADLEALLDPKTALADRQVLFSKLMNANAEIRASVETALRDRKVRVRVLGCSEESAQSSY
jgi:hypothetical protein